MSDRCTCHDVLIVKNLNRWFKEKWVDVSRKDKDGKHPPCGRAKANTSSKGYPKCRPSVKVNENTPKTSGSMSEGQKRAATKRKRAKKQGVGGKPTIVKMPIIDTDVPGVKMGYNENWIHPDNYSVPTIGNQPWFYDENDEITQMTPNEYFDVIQELAGKDKGIDRIHFKVPPIPGRDAPYRWDGMQFSPLGGSRENIARIIEGIKEGKPIGMPSLSFRNNKFTGEQDGGHRMEALRQMGHGDTPVPVFRHNRVVKAMKDEKEMKGKKGMVMVIAITGKPKGKDKVAVKKTDDTQKMGWGEQCHICGTMFADWRQLQQHQQQTGH